MGRAPSHRLMWQDIASQWVRRKAYHLAKVMAPGRILLQILAAMRCVRPGIYAIPPVLVIRAREVCDDFRPYAADEEGKVWE